MLEVVKANRLHAEAIVDFQLKMALETENLALDRDTVSKGVAHIFEKPATGYYRVALNKGEVVASLLVLYEWSDWRNGNVLWVHSVYVLPQYRNKGVFAQMYKQLQEEVKADASLRGIRLYVDKSNEKARLVYRKLGMSPDHYELFEWMKE